MSAPRSSRSPSLFSLLRRDRSTSRLDELCEFAPDESAPQEEVVLWFVQLVGWIRPRRRERARTRVRFLEAQLTQHPEWRENVARALAVLFRSADVEQLLAYGGIPRDAHFLGAVREWLTTYLLPTATRTTDGARIADLAFVERDVAWLRSSGVVELVRHLLPEDVRHRLERALDGAMLALAHHVAAQAHSPSIRALARSERSPFRGIHDAIASLSAEPGSDPRCEAIRGRVKQCLLAVEALRSELTTRGADLNTTFVLRRLQAQLQRLLLLAELRHAPQGAVLTDACTVLVFTVTRAKGKRLLSKSTDLVIQNLVETSANVGRRYLDEEQSSWWAALRAGAGGGALMTIATIVKYLLARLHLPPLFEGLAFSLNYAAAFSAAYLLHWTIATKLPAHTAVALARSVQQTGRLRGRVDSFVAVWRALVRLQFAGLLGNVIVAGPLAALVDVAAARVAHGHILSVTQGDHVLHEHSLLGPSILFAALTGLFLWMSSLVTAAADNWTRVNHLADRLATNVHAMKRVGLVRARGYADRVVPLLGGLTGNVALGFLLGGVPAAFAIASLPIEIRHVTVSTGAVALALTAGAGNTTSIALAISGVVAIAAVNVGVSFLLALWFALRSANQFRTSSVSFALFRLGLRSWAHGQPAKREDSEDGDAPSEDTARAPREVPSAAR